ncbi:MAG: hypothetical protein ABH810_01385 [bacterium]
MPKPTKYAALICLILTVVAAIGGYVGYVRGWPLLMVITLLPAVIYEVYRTEGESTKSSSWLMLLVLVAEAIFIKFKISFDLGQYLGQSEAYIAGSYVPLGDIKVVAPVVMAVLSIILFTRTAGIYTKWLAVIILAASIGIIYVIAPESLQQLLQFGTRSVIY